MGEIEILAGDEVSNLFPSAAVVWFYTSLTAGRAVGSNRDAGSPDKIGFY